MTDLADLIPKSDTVTIFLKHPVTDDFLLKDDGTEMSVTVYTTYSKEYKAAMHEQTNKRLQKAQKLKKAVNFTAEEIDSASIEVLAKTTKGWDLQMGGQEPKFSVAEAAKLYEMFAFIRDQVAEEQEAYTGFLKA